MAMEMTVEEKDALAYAPDFKPDEWTKEEREYLSPFFTNLDGLVTVMRNLPAELAGALCSRASRASEYLLRVFLNEYIRPTLKEESTAVAGELREFIRFAGEFNREGILNIKRARALYSNWYGQFGDDSIGQTTGTHLIFWGVSQVALKYMEDQRVGLEPIEKSTRYVNFGSKANGRYLYYVPAPDLEQVGLKDEYVETMDGLFAAYNNLILRFSDWLRKAYNQRPIVLEKKAFDCLRGLLPMATLSQVAFRGNAQAFEYLINRTREHPLGELRWIGYAALKELEKELPSLFERVRQAKSRAYRSYLNLRRERLRKTVENLYLSDELPGAHQEKSSGVRLIGSDCEAEAKLITALVFEESGATWNQILKRVKKMDQARRVELLNAHFTGRGDRWQKIGRAFENSFLRFEIVLNIGAYRDLHRHRMQTQHRQLFTIIHGYDVPKDIAKSGLKDEFCAALDSVVSLYEKVRRECGPDVAQYVVPMAYRVRTVQLKNFRQFFWEAELRTQPEGHPDYRRILQEEVRLVYEKFPAVARFLRADMEDYEFARRMVSVQRVEVSGGLI